MKKPRSDAKLKNLPEEQRAQLVEWLLSGLPYHTVRRLVADQFKVETSLSALSEFYQEFCTAALLSRRRQAVSVADEVAAEAEKSPGQFDQATIDALKQKAFELAIQPMADHKAVKSIFSLLLKARDQDLESRRIAVLEAKAAKADAAEKIATDSGLSEEERATRMKQLFAMA